ncbi:MAG: nucleotidyltransferase family protein [Synechococcales cyanobacterium CRU_2_2]|nr:nucleotidyltransferase family protein [Synechococcales cyanobacterium CRU_2_2]
MPLRDLITSKREDIIALAARYNAANVRLFGSVARGDDRPDSDVDLLVDVQQQWSLFDHIGLMQDLEDLLGRKIDLIPANSIRDFCRDRILAEAIPL